MDRYAVIGNPIAHSKSPQIHAAFARQTGQQLEYGALLAPLDGFVAAVTAFREGGGRGLNVTVPFKLEAHALATRLSERAEAAGAVNTLRFDDGAIFGDNTDGAGLVRDIASNLGFTLTGSRILLLGAGGAARGAVLPLLGAAPASLTIANRSPEKAELLRARFAPAARQTRLEALPFPALTEARFDLIINATSASLASEAPAVPVAAYAGCTLAYDMMYGARETAFLAAARSAGARRCADGLGMLVEQAAESFALWRGIRPDTAPVLAMLRQALTG